MNSKQISFSSPFLDQYVRTPNRLAFGERTVIVMSSKVAQKSYGTEKRSNFWLLILRSPYRVCLDFYAHRQPP